MDNFNANHFGARHFAAASLRGIVQSEAGGELELREIRYVKAKTLLERILESQAKRAKPIKKSARKKAVAIEYQAADLVVNDGSEVEFRRLMNEWLAQKPVIEEQGIDPETLFMAQVLLKLKKLELERVILLAQDEEDALIALLL